MKTNDDMHRMQYFNGNDIFCFEQVRNRRKKRKSIFNNCPCHQSKSCPFTRYCGPCSSQPNEDIKNDVISESGPSHDIGFQLETLLNPDACVIQIPFTTKESIIPSAALYLNELNAMPYKNEIVSEEVFMFCLQKCARGSITNRDVSSLFPHHNISGSVFNLLVGWWVGKSFFLRCFILFELIWSFYFAIHIIGLMLR